MKIISKDYHHIWSTFWGEKLARSTSVILKNSATYQSRDRHGWDTHIFSLAKTLPLWKLGSKVTWVFMFPGQVQSPRVQHGRLWAVGESVGGQGIVGGVVGGILRGVVGDMKPIAGGHGEDLGEGGVVSSKEWR